MVDLLRFGRHELVELGILGELIDEGHDGAAAFQQTVTGGDIRDVSHLVVRDVQEFGQSLPVLAGLIEHHKELTVAQHGSGGVALEKILHILCDTGGAGSVLAHPLPQGEQEVGAVLMLEQQIDLVDVDPCVFAESSVADYPVEDAVQNNQHAHGQKLFAQIPDVVADDAAVGIYVGALGEGVEAAGSEELHDQCYIPCLGLRLLQQDPIEVLQSGSLAHAAAADIVLVHQRGAAVDDALLLGRQLGRGHQLLEQGENEFGLEDDGVLPVAVALFHI